MTELVNGTDMVDKERFEKCWDWFKAEFADSEPDIIMGYMIITAIKTILEKALDIEPVTATIEEEEADV